MRLPSLVTLVLSARCLVCVPVFASGINDAPEMNSLSAKTAKPGDTLVISGINLNDTRIDEVYLTDHKFDMKMKVLEQKDTYIKVRVPPFAKPGRMQILTLTKGDEPKLLEQPLYLLIRDPTDTTVEIAEPTVETIQMRPEDLPQPGAPISIPILAPGAAPVVTATVSASPVEAKTEAPAPAKKPDAAPQVSQVKKTEPVKTSDQKQ
jgi:hypothetical protein